MDSTLFTCNDYSTPGYLFRTLLYSLDTLSYTQSRPLKCKQWDHNLSSQRNNSDKFCVLRLTFLLHWVRCTMYSLLVSCSELTLEWIGAVIGAVLVSFTLTQINVTLWLLYTFLLNRKSRRPCTILHGPYRDDDPSPDWELDLARLGHVQWYR